MISLFLMLKPMIFSNIAEFIVLGRKHKCCKCKYKITIKQQIIGSIKANYMYSYLDTKI